MRVNMEKIKQNIRDQVTLIEQLKSTRQSSVLRSDINSVQSIQMAMLIEALHKINSNLKSIASNLDARK